MSPKPKILPLKTPGLIVKISGGKASHRKIRKNTVDAESKDKNNTNSSTHPGPVNEDKHTSPKPRKVEASLVKPLKPTVKKSGGTQAPNEIIKIDSIGSKSNDENAMNTQDYPDSIKKKQSIKTKPLNLTKRPAKISGLVVKFSAGKASYEVIKSHSVISRSEEQKVMIYRNQPAPAHKEKNAIDNSELSVPVYKEQNITDNLEQPAPINEEQIVTDNIKQPASAHKEQNFMSNLKQPAPIYRKQNGRTNVQLPAPVDMDQNVLENSKQHVFVHKEQNLTDNSEPSASLRKKQTVRKNSKLFTPVHTEQNVIDSSELPAFVRKKGTAKTEPEQPRKSLPRIVGLMVYISAARKASYKIIRKGINDGKPWTPPCYAYNEKYMKILNDHVHSTKMLEYVDIESPKTSSRLSTSKVTMNGSYYSSIICNDEPTTDSHKSGVSKDKAKRGTKAKPTTPEPSVNVIEDEEFAALPGTLWTSEEKDAFFACLARFSIHRIDEFSPFLPQKTRLEIETYYHLLNNELHDLRKLQSYRIPLKQAGKYNKYTMRVFDKGAPYWKIPAAVEVDEQWLEYEEQQSQHLRQQEASLEATKKGHEAFIMDEYTSHTGSTAESLIDLKIAGEVSSIYGKNRILSNSPELEVSEPRKQKIPALQQQENNELSYDSLVFLDELVKLRLRDLITALLIHKGTNDIETHGPENPHDPYVALPKKSGLKVDYEVTRQDVWQATEDIRLMETKTAGVSSRYRDGKTPVMFLYWEHLPVSLNLSSEPLKYKSSVVSTSFHAWRKQPRDSDPLFRQIDGNKEGLIVPQDLAEFSANGVFIEDSASSDSNEGNPWDRVPWSDFESDETPDISDNQKNKGNEISVGENGTNGKFPAPESLEKESSERQSLVPGTSDQQIDPEIQRLSNQVQPLNPKPPSSSGNRIMPIIPDGFIRKSKKPHNNKAPSTLVEVSSSETESELSNNSEDYSSEIPKRVYAFDTLDASTTYSRKRTVDDLAVERMLEEWTVEYTEYTDNMEGTSRVDDDRRFVGLPVEEQEVGSPPRSVGGEQFSAWSRNYAHY